MNYNFSCQQECILIQWCDISEQARALNIRSVYSRTGKLMNILLKVLVGVLDVDTLVC